MTVTSWIPSLSNFRCFPIAWPLPPNKVLAEVSESKRDSGLSKPFTVPATMRKGKIFTKSLSTSAAARNSIGVSLLGSTSIDSLIVPTASTSGEASLIAWIWGLFMRLW